MRLAKLLCVAVGCVLGCALGAGAQNNGGWRAASASAKEITGDVAFAGERISINFSGFPAAEIRALTPAEIGAAFNVEPDAGGSGTLYRVSIPAEKRFLHKNTLCGSEETQWVATYAVGKSLQLTFFSGAKMPLLTPEALADTTDRCGTFAYVR